MSLELTPEEEKEFEEFIAPFLEHERYMEMQNYIQHGAITTFDHCMDVAKGCLALNRRWNLGADEEALVKAALLHDFFLYDWHERGKNHNLHGFFHPKKAMKNAIHYFDITKHEQKIIKTHMWPLTLTFVPSSREAWILCMVDKYVSTKETLFKRKKKGKV